ncbi:unnamed protein product [Cylindrotheca closterium]|uniref:Uncharacterized protein n=1 Tax=Cylindrotheca closterium TaxID=2856 RepID=A0AAD2JHH3_9STRA|nr:unnamed protein product [Cylindrotheca closterium]
MQYGSINTASTNSRDSSFAPQENLPDDKALRRLISVTIAVVCLIAALFESSSSANEELSLPLPPMSSVFKPVDKFSSPHWKTYGDISEIREKDAEYSEAGGWWKVEGDKLLIAPKAKQDFWRKTYYEPILVKDDGSFLYHIVPEKDLPATIETSFSLTPKAQFDQAGIIIRLDADHWIKTGIEVVDEQARLSCVVTNGFSDWSTQHVSEPGIKIRVHLLPQHGGSFVVEAAPRDTDEWSFIRIAHLSRNSNDGSLNDNKEVKNSFHGESAQPGTLMVGVFAACPVDQKGMVATFDSISITKGSAFVHDA